MLRALLIEDNAAARADLRDRLRAHPDVVVAAETDSVGRARPMLSRGDYDLVFLDIQLRGGDAFDLVPLVVPTARIIFVTAHDEYALRAFEVNALDYLLKPVAAERLAQSLARIANAERSGTAAPFGVALRRDDLVCLRSDEGMQLVPVTDVTVIFAEQNYTAVWLASGQRRLVRRPLKEWESSLEAMDFMRIARDAVVNLRQVVRFERTGDRGANVWVAGRAEPARASFRHWPVVRAALSRHLPA